MAHELTIRANGKAEMALVGEAAWHGLGQYLPAGASIEEWQVAAGMDWKIQRSKVRYSTGEELLEIPDQHILFRSDTKAPLGNVSDKYKIVQPGAVLEFFRDLVDEAGFSLETAGTLFGGKRFWALARIGEDAVVAGEDRVGGFLLLNSSCDGSSRTSARFTTVRVVCNNTLTMATQGKAEVAVSHKSEWKPGQVKDTLGIARGEFATFMQQAKALSKKRMSQLAAADFVRKLLLDTGVTRKADEVHETSGYKSIMNLFAGSAMGGTLMSAEGSAWGLLNAVTEHVDHSAGTKRKSQDHVLWNAWYGPGEALKNAALKQALALL